METKFINVNGNQVADLTPDYNRPLALVDLQVLNQLIDSLDTTTFSRIKDGLRSSIKKAENLEELVTVTDNFTAFHKSVNLIKQVTEREINGDPDKEADLQRASDLDSLEPAQERYDH